MLRIKNYVRASSLQEAYDLCQKRSNVVLGGMLWLKMQDRSIQTAIDLCDLGLDQIIEEQDCYRIGAMVSLRQLETHPGLNALTQGAFADALKSIVGVQFRNLATVGGSLYGRFGFSDVLTMFLALDAKIRLYHRGELTAEEFAALPRGTRDILTEVIVYKRDIRAAYLSQRNSATDFPVVACAVCRIDGIYRCAVTRDILTEVIVYKRDIRAAYLSQRNSATDFPVVACAVCRIDGIYRCAVGARPGKAALLLNETGMLCPEADLDRAKQFGEWVSRKLEFGSNMRAGADYRRGKAALLLNETGMLCPEADLDRAKQFGEWVSRKLEFGSNMRAGADYRRKVCAVLVHRGIMALEEE